MHIFQSQGHPQSPGDVSFFLPPLSPLSMSSIPPSVLKERKNVVKVEDKGGWNGEGMFVSITRQCQRGDRLEKHFLACQGRDPLTGGLRHRKSCDSFHGLLSFPLSLLFEPTFQQQCKTNRVIILCCEETFASTCGQILRQAAGL